MTILQFTPFTSAVDAAFWHALAAKKLDILQLSDAPQPLFGYYTTGRAQTGSVTLPVLFCVPGQGLEEGHCPPYSFEVVGTLHNTNTFEDFQNMDKTKLHAAAADKIAQAIQSGDALQRPQLLSQFVLLTFADLKKYKFYYWFDFPALMPQGEPWQLTQPMAELESEFTADESEVLAKAYHVYRETHAQNGNASFFLVDRQQLRIGCLSEWRDFFSDSSKEPMIGFADPSSVDHPGWPLRNLLALVHETMDLKRVKVLCYRETAPGKIASSRVLTAALPDSSYQPVKAVGWERNAHGKLAPRVADLGPMMDPVRLADTAVDLNLKLMRWRILPQLDLDKIKHTKCLLLGAGTLGCYVARALMGWGVRTITFVDNGRVSFSNPVRQPLYTFNDTLQGGAPKAEAAAKSLIGIQPTMNATGHMLSIPMPGHAHTQDDQLQKTMDTLTKLVEEHDVVFLLTDSRESRWYPTLLAAKTNTLVINAALGFDTYLVMRHGSRHASGDPHLGCYFCNDIVAPADSLSDRTLDQQCTVTRPGLAAVAGALAVELAVSILQHPDGIKAQADSETSSVLGRLPHQIRGFLAQFNNLLIVGQQYERCTACSHKIIEAYDRDPLGFMKKVQRDPIYLEDVSGIAEMKAESDKLLEEADWVDGSDDEFA